MQFQLPDEQRAIRRTVREFGEAEIEPVARDHDAERNYPEEIVEKAAGDHLVTPTVPIEYGVPEHRLHKLVGRVFEGNEASERVLEKVGFEREGRLRDHYYVDGEFLDATPFGSLDDG